MAHGGRAQSSDHAGTASRGRGEWAQPELILDSEQIAVVYKPPFWKCELPPKEQERAPGQAAESEAEKRFQRDTLILLRWIKDKVPKIQDALFDEEFNPAQSGTGFGPLAHRIDAETSGPLLVAKSKAAQRHIKGQFHKTEVSKRYVCLVHGRMAKTSGIVEANIRTFRTDYMTKSEVCGSNSGDWARTDFQVIAVYPAGGDFLTSSGVPAGYSLVACDIKTGRTHQIRVHMSHLGHPLVSDDKYVSAEQLAGDRRWCPRLFLHCFRLRFRDVHGEHVPITCPLPQDLRDGLARIGAAETPALPDRVFSDTSWLRDVLRPPLFTWRPGTRTLRQVAALLKEAGKPLSLSELNKDTDLKQALSAESGSEINKSWLARHTDFFEVVAQDGKSSGGSGFAVQLATGVDQSGTGRQRIDAMRAELDDLHRQKQRAVAEEEYVKAGDIKKRAEALKAELETLAELEDEDTREAALDGAPDGMPPERSAGREKRYPEQRPAEEFKHDVGDEELFPSLGGGSGPPRASSLTPAPRSSSAVRSGLAREPGVGSTAAAPAAQKRSSSAQPQQTELQVARAHFAETSPQPAEADASGTTSLADALFEFLSKKDRFVAHINEINNDKALRKVMMAQKPKPVLAVNKKWLELKENEDVFVFLQSKADTFVALHARIQRRLQGLPEVKSASDKLKDRLKAAANGESNENRSPAYNQVIQKTPGVAAQPLVYNYSSAVRREKSQPPEGGTEASKAPGISLWEEKLSAALGQMPEKSCTAEALLQSVPDFARAMGAKRPREQRELLVMFLQSSPDTFGVEKKGFGGDKQYRVWSKV